MCVLLPGSQLGSALSTSGAQGLQQDPGMLAGAGAAPQGWLSQPCSILSLSPAGQGTWQLSLPPPLVLGLSSPLSVVRSRRRGLGNGEELHQSSMCQDSKLLTFFFFFFPSSLV